MNGHQRISQQWLLHTVLLMEEIFLHGQFQQSRTIPGTQKVHCFILLTKNKLHTKVFSYSSTPKEERVTLSETVELPLEEINGFITVISGVLYTDEDSKTVTMNFPCPQGPSYSFKYQPKQNTISYTDVLTKVD